MVISCNLYKKKKKHEKSHDHLLLVANDISIYLNINLNGFGISISSQYSSWNTSQLETPKMFFGGTSSMDDKLKINNTCTCTY